MICKYLLPLIRISFVANFVYCAEHLGVWCSPICLFLLLLTLSLESGQKKSLEPMPRNLLLIFSSKSFMISGLTFKALSCFELIFILAYDSNPVLFFSMCLFSFPNSIYWKDCPFPIVYSCLLYHKLIDHMCIFISGLLSVPLIYVSFYANTILFCLI